MDSNGTFILLNKPNDLNTQIKRAIIDKKKIEKKPKKKKSIKKIENSREFDEKNGNENKIITKELELIKDDLQELNYDSTNEEWTEGGT